MKQYTKEDLESIRKKRMEGKRWWARMVIHLGIMRFTVEPKNCGFDYWTCYRLNLWNPLTWIYVVSLFFIYVLIGAPIRAMIKEAVNSVNDIISMAKGERYG